MWYIGIVGTSRNSHHAENVWIMHTGFDAWVPKLQILKENLKECRDTTWLYIKR